MQSKRKQSSLKLTFWYSASFVFLFAIAVAVAILGPVFFDDDPKQRLALESLYGTYIPDEESRKFIQSHYGRADTSISFGPDGSCTLRNMPDWWKSPGGTSPKVEEIEKGTWKLVGKSLIHVRTDRAYPGIGITGQQPPYTLELCVGPECVDNHLRYVRAGF